MRMGAAWRSLQVSMVAAVLLGLPACSKIRDAARDMQPGHAFLDSQIPPGLAPQYFPPQGFVWGAYRHGSLPEARYGVASPPVNPKAQVLILADADYPAEAYFETAQQLLDAGYGVWLLDMPGQGGAGRYLLQNDAIYTHNWHDGEGTAVTFIKDVIHPTPDKPLFVVGTGYSAVNALSLSNDLKDRGVIGFVGYDPWLGGPIPAGGAWHRDDAPSTYWGRIAQQWQVSNPDLRLRAKSESWQAQMRKAYAQLTGLHLSALAAVAPVVIMAPKTTEAGARTLCAHLPHCEVKETQGAETLGDDLASLIRTRLSQAS